MLTQFAIACASLIVTPSTQTVYELGETPFVLHAVIKNTSKKKCVFDVMSCSWQDHFKFNDPSITFEKEQSCDKNAPEQITLVPSGEFEKDLAVKFTAPNSKVYQSTFHVNFTSEKIQSKRPTGSQLIVAKSRQLTLKFSSKK